MDTYLVVINYYGEKNTISCLESILNNGSELNIVVVDNGSPVDFEISLKNRFPDVHYIKNDKNIGFAAGGNIGIKFAINMGADNIILLNNDTIVSKNNLENLIHNEGDVVGAILKFKKKKKIIYDLGGYVNWWTGRTYHREIKEPPRFRPCNPVYVSGAVMLIRKKVIEKIGLLDEKYFLYYEDADFCIRARKAGFKITIDYETIVYHKLGATLGRKSIFTLYQNLRSNLIFIFKNISLLKKPIALTYWVLLCAKVTLNWFLYK